MTRLYFHKGACSLASHIALEEAGADYELVKVDFASGEQRSAGIPLPQSQGTRAGAGRPTAVS